MSIVLASSSESFRDHRSSPRSHSACRDHFLSNLFVRFVSLFFRLLSFSSYFFSANLTFLLGHETYDCFPTVRIRRGSGQPTFARLSRFPVEQLMLRVPRPTHVSSFS